MASEAFLAWLRETAQRRGFEVHVDEHGAEVRARELVEDLGEVVLPSPTLARDLAGRLVAVRDVPEGLAGRLRDGGVVDLPGDVVGGPWDGLMVLTHVGP